MFDESSHKYFSLTWIFENICCCFFPRVGSTGPLTLSHPSSSLSEFQLILVKIIVLLRWGFNSYQIFERKWNWQNMFTQIFLSEIISIAENGGQGTHFLISQILKGLTHCAMCMYEGVKIPLHCRLLPSRLKPSFTSAKRHLKPTGGSKKLPNSSYYKSRYVHIFCLLLSDLKSVITWKKLLKE